MHLQDYVRLQHKYSMDYTLIISDEQKQVITKALEQFSVLYLGQTRQEYEDAKTLVDAITNVRSGTTINNLTV